MNTLNNAPQADEILKKKTIKSSNVKVGNSFCLGEENSIQDDKIDVTNDDFLSKLTPALSKKIKDTIAAAEQRAVTIIESAKVEAETIKQQAQQNGIQEGHKIGQQQGYKDGYNQINNELVQKIQAFNNMIESVLLKKSEIYRSGENELIELVMMIAEKLAHTKIEEDAAALKNIIIQACSEIQEKEHIKILINPMFAKQIYSISEELKNAIYGLESIKIIEDKTITEAGVIIEAEHSRVDARLSTQVEILIKKLKEETKATPLLGQKQATNKNIDTKDNAES